MYTGAQYNQTHSPNGVLTTYKPRFTTPARKPMGQMRQTFTQDNFTKLEINSFDGRYLIFDFKPDGDGINTRLVEHYGQDGKKVQSLTIRKINLPNELRTVSTLFKPDNSEKTITSSSVFIDKKGRNTFEIIEECDLKQNKLTFVSLKEKPLLITEKLRQILNGSKVLGLLSKDFPSDEFIKNVDIHKNNKSFSLLCNDLQLRLFKPILQLFVKCI